MSVSIFASAVRPKLWEECLDSIARTSCDIEVVFSGYCTEEEVKPFKDKYPFFKYITTGKIKPAQNYEIARSYCTKETIVWFCDDAETPDDVIGKAYKYWKEQDDEKLILSIQTKESGYGNAKGSLFDMNNHRLFGFDKTSPLMAPLALMSRKYLNDLGGLDRRYVCGQYENDIVMRAFADGGRVEIFGNKDCFIDIDHLEKSIRIGESRNESDFLKRPFATGYEKDREILERSWTENKKAVMVQRDDFEPYEDVDMYEKSQSNKGKWE